MQKTEPLRFNYEFSRVYRRGKVLSGKYLSLNVFERDSRVRRGTKKINPARNRLGVTANRKVRTAVTRNRVRRLLRESYRLLEPELKPGYDLIFMIKSADKVPPFSVVHAEMEKLLIRAGVCIQTAEMQDV